MNEKNDAVTGASLIENQEEKVKSPWPGPKGMIPVTSGRADDANVHNRAYLDNILVEMRLLDSVEPDLTTEIFGICLTFNSGCSLSFEQGFTR